MIGRLLVAMLVLFSLHGWSAAAAEGAGRAPPVGPPTTEQDARININEAGVEQLVQLPGIGPSRAEAIIAERERRRFRRVEDIMRVQGIGRKTFARIRSSIRVR